MRNIQHHTSKAFSSSILLQGCDIILLERKANNMGEKQSSDILQIMQINANLKYVEFLLHVFDSYPEQKTLKEIRQEFKDIFKVKTIFPLLNQDFGVYRLVPLMFIKKHNKIQGKLMNETNNKIKTMRDAIAHYNFSIDENGYTFKNDKAVIKMTYDEFVKFIHEVENSFYSFYNPDFPQ